MSEFETISPQPQNIINYNALNDSLHKLHRTIRAHPDSNSEPLKKFH